MKENKTILTIITVTYNTSSNIICTIESVLTQIKKFKDNKIQYLIVDGSSTDDTIDIISRYDGLTYLSEPDNGIYDAMNKGVNLSKGDWIYFINAGDYLKNIPLDLLDNDKCSDLIVGNVENENGLVIPCWNKGIIVKNTIPHQGAFYRRSCFELYNLEYKIFADYCHNIKLWKNKAKCRIININIAFHSENGISNSAESATELYKLLISEFGWYSAILTYCRFKINGIINKIIHEVHSISNNI